METEQLKVQLRTLKKKKEDVEYEKKLINRDYDELRKVVKISGIVSLVCMICHLTIIPYLLTKRGTSLTLYSTGKYLGSILFMIFAVSFVIFMYKGYDWFLNADNKYSIKLAKKFEKYTVRDKVEENNEIIIRLESEISKIENELYERGENDFEISDKKEIMSAPEIVERKIVERKIIEKPVIKAKEIKIENDENNSKEYKDVNKDIIKEDNKEDTGVDDLLSALDFWDDDDDEFESSSDMWEKDMRKKY